MWYVYVCVSVKQEWMNVQYVCINIGSFPILSTLDSDLPSFVLVNIIPVDYKGKQTKLINNYI